MLSSAQTHTYNLTSIVYVDQFGSPMSNDDPKDVKIDFDILHTSVRIYGTDGKYSGEKINYKLTESLKLDDLDSDTGSYLAYDSDGTSCAIAITFTKKGEVEMLVVYEDSSYFFFTGDLVKTNKKKKSKSLDM
jgi:hypothetical protein